MLVFLRKGRCIDRSRLVAKAHKDNVVFLNYPFRPASVFPDGFVQAAHIRDIDSGAIPPEIRLKSGEILFAWNADGKDLEDFARSNRIPLVKRRDNWRDLLQPFQEKQLTEPEKQAAVRRLEKQGFASGEIEKIRKRVRPAMLGYSGFAWDEHYLGLAEVLEAVSQYRYEWTFKSFYREAMAIANRGTKDIL